MILRLQHLQLAKPHPSTHVVSTKVGDSQPVGLGQWALKTFTIYPSNRARVSRQSVAIFFFLFLFLFLFFSSFYFGRHIGLLFMGFLNLLKVVNEIRVGFAKFRRFGQFFSLLRKPDVHSVWLAKGGRRRLKTMRL